MAEPNQDPALDAGQSGENQRPEWLPDKFESEEAFAKSYSELERKLSQVGEERSALETQLEDLYGRVQQMEATAGTPQAAYDPSQDPMLLAYEQAMENGDYRAALAIQVGLNQAAVAQAVQGMKQPEPERDYESWAFVAEQTAVAAVGGADEWAKYKERVAEEAASENFDGLSAQQAGAKLARIYKMVKADDVLENHQTVAEQQAEAERLAKIQAQTMTGASGRPPQPTRDEAAAAAIVKAARENSYEALISGS